MPKGRESRWQMVIQPLTGACFIVLANVVFILSTAERKHDFGGIVKVFFHMDKMALSDFNGVLH